MNIREPAWRIFSKEFNSATLDLSSGEEKAPSYVVTPLGAKVNRVVVVGVMTEVENIGTKESPMMRARVADPSGSYYLSAGQFQPDTMTVLRELKPPEFVAVVGKARVYAPDENIRLLSIRPETVRRCDGKLRDFWVYETCVSTLSRLDLMSEVMKMDPPSVDEIRKLGYPRLLAEGAMLAASHYKGTDFESYRELVVTALREIASNRIGEIKEIDVEESVVATDVEEVEVSSLEDLDISEDEEKTVIQIIKSLDKNGKGAEVEAVVAAAQKKKIDKDRLDEIFSLLMGKGELFEPVLGRLKLA